MTDDHSSGIWFEMRIDGIQWQIRRNPCGDLTHPANVAWYERSGKVHYLSFRYDDVWFVVAGTVNLPTLAPSLTAYRVTRTNFSPDQARRAKRFKSGMRVIDAVSSDRTFTFSDGFSCSVTVHKTGELGGTQ